MLFPPHGNLQVLPLPRSCPPPYFCSNVALSYLSDECWMDISIHLNKCCVEYISRCKIASFCTSCSCLSFSNPLLLYSSLPHLCLFYFSVLMPLFSSEWFYESVCCFYHGRLAWVLSFLGSWEEKETLGSWSDPRGPLYKAVISRVTLGYDRVVIKQFNRWKYHFILQSHLFLPKCLALSCKYSIPQGKFIEKKKRSDLSYWFKISRTYIEIVIDQRHPGILIMK